MGMKALIPILIEEAKVNGHGIQCPHAMYWADIGW
jgi:hypothetical protein